MVTDLLQMNRQDTVRCFVRSVTNLFNQGGTKMTAQQAIDEMRERRDKYRHEHNNRIKDQIKAIQRKMVEISFLPVPDLEQHKQLLIELKVAKLKLL